MPESGQTKLVIVGAGPVGAVPQVRPTALKAAVTSATVYPRFDAAVCTPHTPL